MLTQMKPQKGIKLLLSERALDVYYCLYDHFAMSKSPTTIYLSTRKIAELTGLAYWEVCLARLELIYVGCLQPKDHSPCDKAKSYRFTRLDIKDYGNEYWDRIAANFLPFTTTFRAETGL